MKLHRDPEMDLTKEEIDVLKSASMPDEVKRYLARQHENIGLKISAFNKVAEAARAEREAIIAVRTLEMVRDHAESIEDYRQRISALKQENRSLVAAAHEAQKTARQLIAGPPVHAASSQR